MKDITSTTGKSHAVDGIHMEGGMSLMQENESSGKRQVCFGEEWLVMWNSAGVIPSTLKNIHIDANRVFSTALLMPKSNPLVARTDLCHVCGTFGTNLTNSKFRYRIS